MPNSSYANRILADIEAKAHGAGWLRSYQAKVLVDQPNHVRVEVRFGVIADYGPPTRKPLAQRAAPSTWPHDNWTTGTRNNRKGVNDETD